MASPFLVKIYWMKALNFWLRILSSDIFSRLMLEKAFETRRNREHGVKSESYRLKHCF